MAPTPLSTEPAAAAAAGDAAAESQVDVEGIQSADVEPADDLKSTEEDEQLEPTLQHISVLVHLATFAMLGVIIRYCLELLMGPAVAHVTDDNQALFLDVPANMVGSLIMGAVGVASKKDIAAWSEPLAIGLSTGLCGSITTFASWNQRMVAIMTEGLWVRGLFGYLLGSALAYYSLLVGIDVADGLRQLVKRHNERQESRGQAPWAPRPSHYGRSWGSLVLFLCLSVVLITLAGVLFAFESFSLKLRKGALGCLVAPLGCWVRWYLSWLNGGGVGRARRWSWLPVGTLAANVGASAIEAITSLYDVVNNTATVSLVVGGLQLGFMGCMSTVSSLFAEVHSLSRGKASRWRAYVYLYMLTIPISAVMSILLYSTPIWVKDLYSSYNQV